MADVERYSDIELWKLAAELHREEAFRTLMSRHRDLVWSVCSRMLRNNSDAEDAFQMTFLALLEQGAAIRSADFGAWLYRVAYRASLRVQANRIEGAGAGAGATTLNAIAESSMGADVFRAIEQAEQSQIVAAAMDSLPEKYREVLVLHYCSEIARDDIAKRLGLTPQTVKARLSRGRAALRSRLMRRGLSLSLAAALFGSQSQAAVVPSDLEADTWRLAQQWLTGEPVSLDIAQFSDFPTMEYGMKSLHGLNTKWSLVAVAAAAALFLVFEAGRVNGAGGIGSQQGVVSSDLNRLRSEGIRTDEGNVTELDEPVRAEIVLASHVTEPNEDPQAVQNPQSAPQRKQNATPIARVPQQTQQPNVYIPQSGGRVATVPTQQYFGASQTVAAQRPGLQDGRWTRNSALGEMSFVVEGRKLWVELKGAGEASMFSGSATGEFSVASDGTVYGLLHSVDTSSIVTELEAREIAAIASKLNDIPFSMRVHTDDGVMAVKNVTLGIPPALAAGVDMSDVPVMGMYLCGTYRSVNPTPVRGASYQSRRHEPMIQQPLRYARPVPPTAYYRLDPFTSNPASPFTTDQQPRPLPTAASPFGPSQRTPGTNTPVPRFGTTQPTPVPGK